MVSGPLIAATAFHFTNSCRKVTPERFDETILDRTRPKQLGPSVFSWTVGGSGALGAGLVPATTQTTMSAYTIHDHVVRFGLNYRFN